MARVLLITTSFPDPALPAGQEAAGAFVQDFARALAASVTVEVVAPGLHSALTGEDGLAVRRFAAPRLPLSLLRPGHPADWRAIVATLRAGQAAVDAACRAARPDHLLALWALPSGAWAQAAARRTMTPVSVWALGSDIWSLGRVPLVRGRLQAVLHRADHRFADGYELAADVAQLAGKPCQFLPSSRRFPAAEKTLRDGPPWRLAFLGRWHRNKGVDLLLDALARLSEEDWRLIEGVRIAGGGPLADEVGAGCAALQALGRPVSLLGYQDRQEAAALFAWADGVLLPSRIESIPVVFSDALQAGCPLVATPVGDLPRLFGQHSVGELAAAADAPAFAAALARLLRRAPAEFAADLAAAGEVFAVDRTAQRFLAAVGLN